MEPCVVILDECIWGCDEIMPTAPLIYDKTLLKTTSVILMQYPFKFNTNITSSVDYVFIYYTPIIHERQYIFKQYGGCFPSYEVFNTILDAITSDMSKYECIVIDNTVKEGGIENRVFWYKAEHHGVFKAGKPIDPNIRQIDV